MAYRFLLTIGFVFSLSLLFVSCSKEKFAWEEGDILFQDGDCGGFCEAIRKVTQGYQGKDFSHNGLLIKENGEWMVLEAIAKGVVLTPLDTFLNRAVDEEGNPKVLVGRLKPEYRSLINPAITHAKTLLGKEYDDVFDFENDKFYCSEVIHVSFKAAQEGRDLFEPKPMTFKDPDTGLLFPIWEEYFAELGVEVPEGAMGLNPGGMSLSPALEILEIY